MKYKNGYSSLLHGSIWPSFAPFNVFSEDNPRVQIQLPESVNLPLLSSKGCSTGKTLLWRSNGSKKFNQSLDYWWVLMAMKTWDIKRRLKSRLHDNPEVPFWNTDINPFSLREMTCLAFTKAAWGKLPIQQTSKPWDFHGNSIWEIWYLPLCFGIIWMRFHLKTAHALTCRKNSKPYSLFSHLPDTDRSKWN